MERMLTREQALKVKQDAIERFLTEDGGMYLKPGEHNDNELLFTTLFDGLLDGHGILDESDADRFESLVIALSRKDEPALMHREVGRSNRDEAHDNYNARVYGTVLMEFRFKKKYPFIDQILEYGPKHGWIFQNVDMEADDINPHLKKRREKWWFKLFGMDVSRWRQGSEVCYYKLAKGHMPAPWELLWFMGASVMSILDKKLDGNFLSMMRFDAIQMRYEILKREDRLPKWQIIYAVSMIFRLAWQISFAKKSGGRGFAWVFDSYISTVPDHPLRLLSRRVMG